MAGTLDIYVLPKDYATHSFLRNYLFSISASVTLIHMNLDIKMPHLNLKIIETEFGDTFGFSYCREEIRLSLLTLHLKISRNFKERNI